MPQLRCKPVTQHKGSAGAYEGGGGEALGGGGEGGGGDGGGGDDAGGGIFFASILPTAAQDIT